MKKNTKPTAARSPRRSQNSGTKPPALQQVEPNGGYVTNDLNQRFISWKQIAPLRDLLEAASINLRAANELCVDGDTCEALTDANYWHLFDRFSPTYSMPDDVNCVAWAMPQRAHETIDVLAELLRVTSKTLVEQIKEWGPAGIAEHCLKALLDSVLPSLEELATSYEEEYIQGRLQAEAEQRRDMPALVSIFSKEDEAISLRVRESLQLGKRLPYRVNPRRPLSLTTTVAMAILERIEAQRHDPSSLYCRAYPDLARRKFGLGTEALWENAVALHIDHYQGTPERRQKVRFEHNIGIEELVHRPDGIAFMSLEAIGWKIQKRAKDSQASSAAQVRNRVKGRIVRAIRELVPN